MGFKVLNSTFQSGRDKYQRIGIPDFPFQCEKILNMEILPHVSSEGIESGIVLGLEFIIWMK